MNLEMDERMKKPSTGNTAMIQRMREYPLPVYFSLVFVLSWSAWVPLALDHYSLLPSRLNPGVVLVGRLLGTFGPAVAAILVSGWSGGKPAVKALLGLLKKWQVGWIWYAAAGLVFPALLFVVAGIYKLLPGAAPLPLQPISAANLIVTAIFLVLSVLGEEIGWRGFALPNLQKRWPALKTSLVLGTIHTIWHLPFWIVLGELETFGPGYWLLSWAWVLALTTYLTWLMNNTGNSLLIALLFHGSFNIASVGFLPITTVIPAYLIFILLAWTIMIGLLRHYGTGRLVRLPAAG
jgi:membrane protease YdiL (CAAX protease family)